MIKVLNKIWEYRMFLAGLVIALLGFMLGRNQMQMKQLKDDNKAYQTELKALQQDYKNLDDLLEEEQGSRERVYDSLTKLHEINLELVEKERITISRYERSINNIINHINSDTKRDSLLSRWYPTKGQRNIRPIVEN